jgi:hypothetical protein
MNRFAKAFVTAGLVIALLTNGSVAEAVDPPTITSVSSTGVITSINVVAASRNNDIATLTTARPHRYQVGQSVTVRVYSSDSTLSTFNPDSVNNNWSLGVPAKSVVVLAVPTPTTFTYANTGSNSPEKVVTDGSSTVGTLRISNAALTSNVATLTTETVHGYAIGDWVYIDGIQIGGIAKTEFSGTFQISAVPTTTTFSYSVTASNVTSSSTSLEGTSTTTNKRVRYGDTVKVKVNFSEVVNITGWPVMIMETGTGDQTATCFGGGCAGSNLSSMTLAYKVRVGDISPDLNYQSTVAILLNGATIKNAGNSDATLTLPALNSANSLAGGNSIVVDTSLDEDEQWITPISSVAGLHGLQLSENLRENVSYLRYAGPNWSRNDICNFSVSNKQLTSNVATLTTLDVDHTLTVGESVTITGIDNTFNGSATITAVSTNTISYAKSGSNVASTTTQTGTISRPCENTNVTYRAVLKRCENNTETDCIEGLYASSSAITEKTGSFESVFPKRGVSDFASPMAGVPSGGTMTFYSFADFGHDFGNEYAVTATLSGWQTGDGQSSGQSVFASINPVSTQATPCADANNGRCMDDADNKGTAVDQDQGYKCFAWDVTESNTDSDTAISFGNDGDESTCALKHAFPAGVTFKLKLRLSKEPGGWVHGRMANPSVSFEESGSNTVMTVAAEPVKVPAVGAVSTFAGLPANIQNWFQTNCSSSGNSNCGSRNPDNPWTNTLLRNAIVEPLPYRDESFNQLSVWNDFINDTAGAEPTQWNVRTLDTGEMEEASACIRGATGITGVVTTNSTLYSKGPPTYNSTTQTLDYRVAAPHFKRDGVTPFLGEYHLLVREDVAKCLYGFSGSAVTSDVDVLGEDGAAKSAQTSITKVGDYYHFSATGFTFSAPTIKAKLQGVQAAAAPVVAAPAVEIPAVTIPAVTIPAVTIPAVTVPAVTVPVVTVPVLTPKVGTPVVVASPPAAQVAAGLGMSAEKAVVRTSIKVPALVKGVGIKSYQVVLRSSTGKIVALQTIAKPVPGKVMPTKLTAPSSGNYKVEIVATTTKGKKLPKWTSPSIKLKK